MDSDEVLETWLEYSETAQLVRTRVALRMQHESGLSPADYLVLRALADAPDNRIRPFLLAETIGWERSRLSHQLSRMRARALIVHEECETDNRGTVIRLSDTGAKQLDRARVPHVQAIRELFIDALTPEQLDWALVIGERLRAHLDDRLDSSDRPA